MAVPYVFASLPNGTAIPLSYLDADFSYLTTSPSFSGNVTIGGTLGVTGATTLSSTLGVTGSATFGSTMGITGTLTLGSSGTAQGVLVLSGATSGAVTVRAAAAAGSWTFTLPTSAGTNGYILTTNGAGVSSWTDPTALGIDVNIDSTVIAGGVSGRVLYDNAGVFGEYTVTGTAGSVVLSTSPTITTPTTSGNITATGVGARFLADFTNATFSSRFAFQTSTANSVTSIFAMPSGTGTSARWEASNSSDLTNASKILIQTNGSTDVQLASSVNGTGTYLPLSIYTNNGQSAQFSTTRGTFTLGVAASAQGILNLTGATSGTVSVRGAAAAGTWTFTLPTTGGTNNYVLTTNGSGTASWSQVSLTAGVTGVLPVANGGTNASSAGITAFNNITGYTASGATGTTSTNIVFSGSPTIATPAISGVTNASNASAGNVGEVISSSVVSGSQVSLTSTTAANVTSISLTAGDWDVTGTVVLNPAGTTTVTAIAGGISTTSATLVTTPDANGLPTVNIAATLTTGAVQRLSIATYRINVSSTTTVYLVAQSTFATSTMGAFGAIVARRAR